MTLRVNSNPKHSKLLRNPNDYVPPNAPESSDRAHLFIFGGS